jgi:hypothetical protein
MNGTFMKASRAQPHPCRQLILEESACVGAASAALADGYAAQAQILQMQARCDGRSFVTAV